MAYLVIKLVSYFTKLKLEAHVIALVFIFANILDASHVGVLRMWGHNPIGTLLFTSFWILFFGKFNLVEQKYYGYLLIASALHIVGDLLFSGYYLFIPFNYDRLTIFAWNSFEDLVTESLLAIIFLGVFILSKDSLGFRKYLVKEKKRFFSNFSIQKIFKPEYFLFEALVLFLIFAFVQFNINLFLNFSELIHGVWYVWEFTLLFLLFQYYIAFPLIYSGKTSQKNI